MIILIQSLVQYTSLSSLEITTASASLHQSRSIIRRAERLVNELGQEEKVREELRKYLNRLSDTIFMLARAEVKLGLIDQVKNKVLEKLNTSKKSFSLTLNMASQLAQAAEKHSEEIGLPIVFSVVDEGGNMMLLHRMEGSLLGSIDISENKAYSAVALQMPTHELSTITQPHTELYGIQATNDNKIVTFGGGYPLIINDQIIGGIGVSGGTVEQDMQIDLHALSIIEQ